MEGDPGTPPTPPSPKGDVVNTELVAVSEQLGGEQKRLISMSLTRMMNIEFESWNLGAVDTKQLKVQRWELEERLQSLRYKKSRKHMTYSPTGSESGEPSLPLETPASDGHFYTLSADTDIVPPAPLPHAYHSVRPSLAISPTSLISDATPHPEDPRALPQRVDSRTNPPPPPDYSLDSTPAATPSPSIQAKHTPLSLTPIGAAPTITPTQLETPPTLPVQAVATPVPCVPSDYAPTPALRHADPYQVRPITLSPARLPPPAVTADGPLLTGYEDRVEAEKNRWREELEFKRRLAEERKKWEEEHKDASKELDTTGGGTGKAGQDVVPVAPVPRARDEVEEAKGAEVVCVVETRDASPVDSEPIPDASDAPTPPSDSECSHSAEQEEDEEGFVSDDDMPMPAVALRPLYSAPPEEAEPILPVTPPSPMSAASDNTQSSKESTHLPDTEKPSQVEVAASSRGPWLLGKAYTLKGHPDSVWVTPDNWEVPGAFKHVKPVH